MLIINCLHHLFQTVSLADSLVYQQVKYLQRSVHEINQLLEESMEPFTGEDVSSLEEEETALISPMNNSTPDSVNTRSESGNIMSSAVSISRRFEEARLDSSESVETPTVQTESVTSVSVSPFLETNNIVSTNGSDKDLLYENSTMDDVEAISTSYEEPGRSVEMLFDNSQSKSNLDSLQEDRNRSVEMLYDDSHSKSADELLQDESKSIEMICEDSNSKSVTGSRQSTGRCVEMQLVHSKSKTSVEDECFSRDVFCDSTNSKSAQDSFEGHEKIESFKFESSQSDKDTDKQIECRFSEMDSSDTHSQILNQSMQENKRKFDTGMVEDGIREGKEKIDLEPNSSNATGNLHQVL